MNPYKIISAVAGELQLVWNYHIFSLRNIQSSEYGIRCLLTLKSEDGDLIFKDRTLLSSYKSRCSFAKKCGNIPDLTEFLMKLEEIAEEELKKATQINPSEMVELSEVEIAAAQTLLKTEMPLFEIIKMVQKNGVAGEEVNVGLYYLIFVSGVTGKPISAIVKGASSAGKSYVLQKVMEFVPDEAYLDITDATAQSFYYAEPDAFKNKIIVIFEKHGGDKSNYSIRSLQSEGKLKIQCTIKDPSTGQLITDVKEVEGPVGFITTTTSAGIHPENETRNFSLFPDETIEQTERAFQEAIKQYDPDVQKFDEETKEKFQNIFRVLSPHKVFIPYRKILADKFPKHKMRTRRDFPRFLSLIEVITLLHQYQRQKMEKNGKEWLIATLADYHIAWTLMRNILSRTINEIPPKTEELLKVAKEISESSEEPFVTFNTGDLAQKIGWDKDTVRKWLKPAIKHCFLREEVESRGPKPAEYSLNDVEIRQDLLPDYTALRWEMEEYGLDEDCIIYDPITGEKTEEDSADASTDVQTLESNTHKPSSDKDHMSE
jgi:DNA primase